MGILRYTGHPFIDVGVATITAFAGKLYPYQVDEDDLTEIANYLIKIYLEPPYTLFRNQAMSLYMNALFFPHMRKTEEEKAVYAREMFFGWKDSKPIEDIYCSFFPGKPAVKYAYRQHIPLLSSRETANFIPNGRVSSDGTAGIPVSGEALLAIHALSLGYLKCGNFLIFHQASDPADPKSGYMNRVLAARALTINKAAIANLDVDPTAPIPSFGSAVRSRYIDEILQAKDAIALREESTDISFISAYSFSNYGPNPRIEIIQLDQMILDFVNTATQEQKAAWNLLVHKAWQKPKKEEEAEINNETTRQWRNGLYEALFELPKESSKFLHRFLMNSTWPLVNIFLRKVMQMEQERIDVYKNIGDRLAEYMIQYELSLNKFYIPIARAKNYAQLRRIIENAEYTQLKQGAEKPLITFDEFITAFEHPSLGYTQWQLGRDLILMRLREAIYANRQKFDPDELTDLPEAQITEEED